MKSIEIGIEVELIPGHYAESYSNPVGIKGVVDKILSTPDLRTIYVNWENGASNSYFPEELQILNKESLNYTIY